ncbi:MAG: LruC domain-containing protein [Turneriella sp.]|nr:LruC domain-containing protein [Turneriella sp.]
MATCKGSAQIEEAQSNLSLPPDRSADTLRTADYYYMQLPGDTTADKARDINTFSFASLLDTTLEINLKVYNVVGKSNIELEKLKRENRQTELLLKEPISATVIIKSKREKRPIFVGRSDNLGRLKAKISLQPGFDDCIIEIYRPKTDQKTIELPKASTILGINRSLTLVQSNESVNLPVLTDSDGDGIADVYDAFPNDAQRAFQVDVPVVRFLTVAFEDNFPGVGDADFNDFVARYYVSRTTNADGKIVELTGIAEAVARAAGYDHRFGILINFAGAGAQVSIRYNDYNGNQTSNSTYHTTDSANLILFNSTKQAFTRLNGGSGVDNGYNSCQPPVVTTNCQPRSNGHSTNFTVTFDAPIDATAVDDAPFDPYIYVHNTGYDVHLLGKPPLVGTNNPAVTWPQGFRDATGWPRGLLVPMDWANPIEGTFIETAYPRFNAWRTSFGTTDTDWYLTRLNSLVVLQDFITPGSQIRNEYLGQANLNGGALIVNIQTNGQVSYLNSINPQFIYNGSYVYDPVTRRLHIDFTTIDQIDSNCQAAPCPVLTTYPASIFSINPDYSDIQINGIVDNTLSVTFVASNTSVSFFRRNGFGPYDE